jgi:hypothetical protein
LHLEVQALRNSEPEACRFLGRDERQVLEAAAKRASVEGQAEPKNAELRNVDPRKIWKTCMNDADPRQCYEETWPKVVEKANLSKFYQNQFGWDQIEAKLEVYFSEKLKADLDAIAGKAEAIASTCNSGRAGPAFDFSQPHYSSPNWISSGRLNCLNSGMREFLNQRTVKFNSPVSDRWVEARILIPAFAEVWNPKIRAQGQAEQKALEGEIQNLVQKSAIQVTPTGTQAPSINECLRRAEALWFKAIPQSKYAFAPVGAGIYQAAHSACRRPSTR